jgi:hypothetical protein
MSPLTEALIDYWQALPAQSAALRQLRLEEAGARVRDGALGPEALVPFALADADAEVVVQATLRYVGAGYQGAVREAAVAEALEWIRRGLALNRGAVFAALLSLGDKAVDESLAGLRLGLSAEEVATVCRLATATRGAATREFLRSWLELLGAVGPTPERAHLSRALALALD